MEEKIKVPTEFNVIYEGVFDTKYNNMKYRYARENTGRCYRIIKKKIEVKRGGSLLDFLKTFNLNAPKGFDPKVIDDSGDDKEVNIIYLSFPNQGTYKEPALKPSNVHIEDFDGKVLRVDFREFISASCHDDDKLRLSDVWWQLVVGGREMLIGVYTIHQPGRTTAANVCVPSWDQKFDLYPSFHYQKDKERVLGTAELYMERMWYVFKVSSQK